MKKFMLIVAMMLPCSIIAGEEPEVYYWICSQAGYVQNHKTYAVTNVFTDTPNDYEAKEAAFENKVREITEGDFNSDLDASCRDFSTGLKAKKYLKKVLISAQKRRYSIFWIDFSGLKK